MKGHPARERAEDGVSGCWRAGPTIIEDALGWLGGEIGDKYDWCNIANAVSARLHLLYCLTRENRYNCSSLATRSLMAWASGSPAWTKWPMASPQRPRPTPNPQPV